MKINGCFFNISFHVEKILKHKKKLKQNILMSKTLSYTRMSIQEFRFRI